MDTGRVVTFIAFLLLVVTGGGLVWLASSPMMPPVQTVQQAIPDDRIPR